MTSNDTGEAPDSHSDAFLGIVVVLLLVTFTGIGLWVGLVTESLGPVRTWFWMGIGVSVTYLLYNVALGVRRIERTM